MKDFVINIQLEPGHNSKQIARLVPLHRQEYMGREVEKLMNSGHLETLNDVDEDCLVSPVLIIVKSDMSVNIALDSRKLSNS